MFINFTNHPSSHWDKKQRQEAEYFGEIVDEPFPEISPMATSEEIKNIAKQYAQKIIDKEPNCVLCQGEFGITYHVVSILLQHGIKVVAACSERQVKEVYRNGCTEKTVVFEFVQYREY